MNEKTCDFLIVGAGVIGVSIAREIKRRYGATVLVLEKGATAALHARSAELVSDFVIEPGPRSTHVLNAVSPAFTASLSFAERVVDKRDVE